VDDKDRGLFLETLGQACGKTDWQVHAYCLMGTIFISWWKRLARIWWQA
jgi:hypothetical protein